MITLQIAWFIILSAFLVEMSRLAFRSTQDPPLANALVLSLMLLALYPFDWFPLLFPAIGVLWGVVLLVLFGTGRVKPNPILGDIDGKHHRIYYGYLACIIGMIVCSGVSCAGLWNISCCSYLPHPVIDSSRIVAFFTRVEKVSPLTCAEFGIAAMARA